MWCWYKVPCGVRKAHESVCIVAWKLWKWTRWPGNAKMVRKWDLKRGLRSCQLAGCSYSTVEAPPANARVVDFCYVTLLLSTECSSDKVYFFLCKLAGRFQLIDVAWCLNKFLYFWRIKWHRILYYAWRFLNFWREKGRWFQMFSEDCQHEIKIFVTVWI